MRAQSGLVDSLHASTKNHVFTQSNLKEKFRLGDGFGETNDTNVSFKQNSGPVAPLRSRYNS